MKYYSIFVKHQPGYVALFSVIGLGVIGGVITFSLVMLGIGLTKSDLQLMQSTQARQAATSCVEEALQKIRETGTTSASGALTIASSSCAYAIASSSGQRIITSTGTASETVSKIKVIVSTTTPLLQLSSWQDVPDF
jgi:hypothetical protein